MRRIGTALLLVLALCGPLAGAASATAPHSQTSPSPHGPPVYAYFYQWFNHDSWQRAKVDYPLAGKYSSDDPKVLHDQISQAQTAGLDGFLTSWKSTATLNHRLSMLLQAAQQRHFDVGVVYEALDFARRPLPIATVRSDMAELVQRWGDQLRSRYFGRPLIIWTGINDYSLAEIRSVRRALGDTAYLLASSKNAQDYQHVASLVDGDAYYWSSASPGTSYTRQRLQALATAVHHNHGIWLAPATAGFDGKTLGHQRVVPRDGGQALTRSLADALTSTPDAIGVISWNEWSENTYIEPGQRYGRQELQVLSEFLHQPVATSSEPAVSPGNTRTSNTMTWTGLRATAALGAATLLTAGLLVLRTRRRTTRGRE